MDNAAQKLAKTGKVDMLDGAPKGQPKPTLAGGVPTIYVSQQPDRAHRLQGPARFRADQRHATPVGVEHVRRRVHRHHQQPVLRADGRTLVPRQRH